MTTFLTQGSKTDVLIFQNISLAMLIVCLLGVLVVVLYGYAKMPKNASEAEEKLYGVGHFFIPSFRNVSYHLFAALLTLTFIQEIGWALFKYWTEIPIEVAQIGDMTFSFVSGTLGGYIVARILKFAHKKLNKE